MVRKMYKCKYLKLPGNHFTSNKSDENRGDDVYGCGVWRDKLGKYAIAQKNNTINTHNVNLKSSYQTNFNSIMVKDKNEKYVTK